MTNLPAYYKIIKTFYLGRFGVLFTTRDCKDQYGCIGSSGREWKLVIYRNPK